MAMCSGFLFSRFSNRRFRIDSSGLNCSVSFIVEDRDSCSATFPVSTVTLRKDVDEVVEGFVSRIQRRHYRRSSKALEGQLLCCHCMCAVTCAKSLKSSQLYSHKRATASKAVTRFCLFTQLQLTIRAFKVASRTLISPTYMPGAR